MDDLILALLQFLLEFVCEVLLNVPFDWPSRMRKTPEPERMTGVYFLWLVAGAALAGLSLLLVPRSLIHLPALRIANAVLAPITSALIALALAHRRAAHNRFIVPRHHAWQAFWFTLGLVAVRLAFAAHGA